MQSGIPMERGVKKCASEVEAWGKEYHSDRERYEKVMLRSSMLGVKSSILTEMGVRKSCFGAQGSGCKVAFRLGGV